MKHTFPDFKHRKGFFFNTALLTLLITFNYSFATITAQHTLTLIDVGFDATTGTITYYLADSVNIIIPASFNIDGEDVSVTTIGDFAFYQNSLTSVTIPNSVITIGGSAFCYNSLISVTIGNNVTSIGGWAFSHNSLSSVTISNSVTTIGDRAFENNALTSVTFEQNSNIRLIKNYAFTNNTGLASITLPSNANSGFSGYKDIEGNRYAAGDNIADFETSYYAVLPAHTLTIENVEFDNATGTITDYTANYTDIIIPSSFNVDGEDISITSIGGWAFDNNALTGVTFEQDSYIRLIKNPAFTNNIGLTSITLPSNANSGFSGYKDIRGNSYAAGDNITDFETTYYAILPAQTLTIDNVEFDATTGTITDYTASYTDIIIPSSFNIDGEDVSVTTIGDEAFPGSYLTSVTMPNSVTTIGDWAFVSNFLTNVTIPNSVTTIGYSAFTHNSLTSVTFEQDSYIRLIKNGAFTNNTGLASITLPSNANSGFSGYKDIEGNSYTAGDNITDLGTTYYAVLPGHTLTINDVDFDATTGTITDYSANYTGIIIPSSFNIDGEDVSVTTIGDEAFVNNFLTSVTMPNSVTTIGGWAFVGNFLTSVTIPNSVTTIGDWAFTHNSLSSVTFEQDGYIRLIKNGAFTYNTGLASITLPSNANSRFSGYKDIKGNRYAAGDNIADLETSYYAVLPTHTITLDDVYFQDGIIIDYYGGYVNIIIPASFNVDGEDVSVTSIGNEAFASSSLTSITIPNSVNTIGVQAFVNNHLTLVTLPRSVTAIEYRAFTSNFLTSMTIPNSVTTIGDEAFQNNFLTSVTFEQDSYIRLIKDGAFYNNTGLASITLPSNANSGFSGYKNIRGNSYAAGDNIADFETSYYAVLPTHTITLDDVDFQDGTITDYYGGYVNIIIPASFNVDGEDVRITTIGNEAFAGNFLTSVTMPNSVTTIGNSAFYRNKLTSITLPAPVTKEGYTFTEWQNGSGAMVTEITDFETSYEAMFNFTGLMVSGNITTGNEQGFAMDGLKSVAIDDMEGVTLYITGDITSTRSVNADGTYSFALNTGRNIVITPIKEGYAFSPANITIDNIQSDVANQDFTPVTTAVNNTETSLVNIYPIPVNDILTIELAGAYNNLQIINLIGTVVKTVDCTGLSTVQVNMESLKPGVYIIKLTGKEGTVVKKVLKK